MPFSESYGDNTAKLCNLIDKLDGNVVTVGDFNLPGIDWARNFSNSAGEKLFLEVLTKKF